MQFPSHPALNRNTGFLLRKVATVGFDRFAAVVAVHGLHPMHFGVLSVLDADGPISQHELSRRTGIDPSSMVARMDVLEERGLVTRRRSSGDRRSYDITLTAAGRTTLEDLREAARAHHRLLFAPLSEGERRQLHGLLEKLAAAIDAEQAEAPSGDAVEREAR